MSYTSILQNPLRVYRRVKLKVKKIIHKQTLYSPVVVGRGAKRVIYHVGAWEGNWGDTVIQAAIIQELGKISKFKLCFTPVNSQKSLFDKSFISKINKEADLLLIGGGGLVFYRPEDGSLSGWQFNIHLEDIAKIKVPIAVYGIGFNKFRFDKTDLLTITNKHLKKLQEKSKLFSVRDQGTKKELIRRGLDPSNLEVIADPAMFLETKEINLPNIDNKKIKIGVNLALDRFRLRFPEPSEKNMNNFLQVLAEGLKKFVEKNNGHVWYISHVGEEIENKGIDSLKQALGSNLKILDEVVSKMNTPSFEYSREFVDAYRQMDVVIGMRGHANIIPFGVGTPFIVPVSHNKNLYFLEEIGMSWLSLNIDRLLTPNEVADKIEEVLVRKKEFARLQKKAFKKFKETNFSFNKKVLGLLG